jgi:hypothetical protein
MWVGGYFVCRLLVPKESWSSVREKLSAMNKRDMGQLFPGGFMQVLEPHADGRPHAMTLGDCRVDVRPIVMDGQSRKYSSMEKTPGWNCSRKVLLGSIRSTYRQL